MCGKSSHAHARAYFSPRHPSLRHPPPFLFRWTPGGRSVNFRNMSKVKGVAGAPEDTPNLPFEDALHRLEGIVEAMEAQDLPLETLLAKFEEGTKLAQLCQSRLNEAELKIQQVEKNAKGELSLKPAALTESL